MCYHALVTLLEALPWALLLVLGTVYFFTRRKSTDGSDSTRLQAELAREKSEKDELIGRGKQLYADNVQLKADYKALARELEASQKKIAQYDAREEHREKEFQSSLAELRSSKQSWEEEKLRIRAEDAEKLRKEEEERDRIWAEHELSTIGRLTELCKAPECNFVYYSNTELPAEFDGSLKPDFMIELLGQYVIFDAKASKAKSLQIYINDTVKKTVQKVKGNEKVARMIFLVVPTSAIHELKSHIVFQEGYTFYIVSREALAPILAGLKRISAYEFAEKLDPQEREKIIHLVASLDYHINERNAFDVLMAQRGSAVLYDAQKLYPEISEEVRREKEKMRLPNFRASDLKRLIANVDERDREIEDLTSPKPEVDKRDIKRMQKTLIDA